MTRVLALLALLFVPALAFAQSVSPAPSATDPLVITTVLVAISGLMAFLRSVAPNESWAHTKWGAFALTIAGAVLNAIYPVAQHGLDGRAILVAALGGIGALVGVVNPSGKAIASKAAALLLPFVLVLGACAGWNAWSVCELGKLPQTIQTVIPAATQALEQGSEAAALAALESIGTGLAPGQLECIVEAIAADAKSKGMARANAVLIVQNARAFRAKHPARLSCDRL